MSIELIKELRAKTSFGMSDCKNALQEANDDMDKAITILQKKGLKKINPLFEAVEGEVRAHSYGQRGVILELNCQTDFAARSEPFQKFLTNLFSSRELAFDGAHEVEEELKQLQAVLGEEVRLRRVDRLSSKDGFVFAYNHPGGKIAVLVSLIGMGVATENMTEVAEHVAMHIAATAPKYVTQMDVPVDLIEKQKENLIQELVAENAAKASPKILQPAMVEKIIEGKLNRWLAESVLTEQMSVVDPKKTIAAILGEMKIMPGALEFYRFERGEVTK